MNDYGDDEPVGGGPVEGQQWFELARSRVKTPGLLLQVFASVWVALSVMYTAANLLNPDGMINAYFDWVEDMQKKQPPEQRQKLPPRDEAIKSQRIQGPVFGIIGLVAGIFMFVGGSKMRQLRGYGWSIAGSVLAIFPGLCCCCFGLVPGIWSLIVLLNSDVRLAFTRVAAGPAV